MNPTPLQPGTVMSTVMLSPVIDGLLRTWETSAPVTWKVDDPDALRAQLGRGDVARAPVAEGRFREVGLLTDLGERGVLMVPKRFQNGDSLEGVGYELRRVQGDPGIDSGWSELQGWLRTVALSAAERGEMVLLERAGWEAPREPYALFLARRGEQGWFSFLQAAPAPSHGLPPWPFPPPRPELAHLNAPATRPSITGAATALLIAIREWAASPFDVGVTFGRSPDGPMPLDPEPVEAASAEEVRAPPAAQPLRGSLAPEPPASPGNELAHHLDQLGANLRVRQFVQEVARRRAVASQPKAAYVNVRRPGSSSVAMYVHRAKVSIALDPRRAEQMAARLPGAVLQTKSAATSYLVLEEEVLLAAPQELLALAVEAVDR